MKHVQPLILCALVLGTATTITQANEAPKPSQSNQKTSDVRPSAPDRGQQVFAQNCSRCHNAPQGFSSHISGTIARHMRVRAGLSDEDYKALRQFLNP
jgi:mono/diheme cytochrome c family protein